MKVYFSGGSPIVETSLKDPYVMLSYFVDAKKGKPTSRMRNIITLRKTQRKEKK